MLTNQFPGVHVKEVPSGARPIASIATSNTAFIDVFARGPLNTPVRVTSQAQFDDIFGGPCAFSEASYAIQHYFLNGGNVAFVVRLDASDPDSTGSVAASRGLRNDTDQQSGDPVATLTALQTGAWGNDIRVGFGARLTATETVVQSAYDLLIRRYDGTRIVVEEIYEDIEVSTQSANTIEAKVNGTSMLVSAGQDLTTGPLADRIPRMNQADGTLHTLDTLKSAAEDDLWPLEGGIPAFSTAATTVEQAVPATGGTPVLTIKALSPGLWGDDLRVAVGVPKTEQGDAPSTSYDLLVRLYRGGSVLIEETYTGLSTTADPADPKMAETVVNGASRLVEVEVNKDISLSDETRLPQMADAKGDLIYLESLADREKPDLKPLVGGGDGMVPGVAGWEDVLVKAITTGERKGLAALEDIVPDIFNLMCIPVAALMSVKQAAEVYEAAEKFCRDRFAFLLVDPAKELDKSTALPGWFAKLGSANSRNAAGYWPRLSALDPLAGGRPRSVAPSGMIAGQMARIDASRGIWKSTAGTETRFAGGVPEDKLTDLEQEPLNRQGLNALRTFPVYGNIIWGARTLVGADALADEYKYVAVRRTALFIQQSLQRGLKWTVFEGNDERLWGQIRMNVKTFMQGLHRQGAFQGTSADDAYLVKCDDETTTQGDIDLGIVNILVAFAPLKPAEFVVLNFKQLTRLPG